MKIKSAICELHPRRAFRIARARRDGFRNVFLALEQDGITGYGEASPNAFYGETAESVLAHLQTVRPWLENVRVNSVAAIGALWDEVGSRVAPSRAAQCAIDLALWDWLARKEKVSVVELATGAKPRAVETFCTIGLSEAAELPAKVAELAGFPLIKIKSDAQADLAPVRFVREHSAARLAVDANGAWGVIDLPAIAAELIRLGVTFLEQPLPPGADEIFSGSVAGLPILADESCVVETDVPRAGRHYAGFNIKLVKCGGITPGLRMARAGRELGQQTMVGCMIESSLLIAAGAVIGQLTDYADLDGAWLLADDPVRGWIFDQGILRPDEAIGLGAEPDPRIFAESAE